MAGFLVPFVAGGLTKALQIRDEYDENAGNIVDAASAKYNKQFDENQKIIELQNSNYAAVEAAHGTMVAEIAAKQGLLERVNTPEVVSHVEKTLTMPRIAKFKAHGEELKKKGTSLSGWQTGAFQTLFSDDYAAATKKLEDNREWAANNLNKGAISNITDLYLEKDTKETALGKAQKFMFGDRVTEGTGVAFDQAVAKQIGDEVSVQPKAIRSDIKTSIADQLGFQETVYAGSVNDINRSISSVLGLEKNKGFELDNQGNFLFQTRFITDANSIRASVSDVAATYQFTGADGKPDTNKIVQMAHAIVNKEIINPSKSNFTNLTLFNKDVFNEKRNLVASGLSDSFTKTIDGFDASVDLITDKEVVKKPKRTTKVGGITAKTLPTQEVETGNFLVTEKVADALIAQVQAIPYRVDQITYIDYMADNFFIQVKTPSGEPAKMKLKDYITSVMGLKRF